MYVVLSYSTSKTITSFIVWKTHSSHATLLNPTFYNVFPNIEKRCIKIRAAWIYKTVHLPEALGRDALLMKSVKDFQDSGFAHVDTSNGSQTYRIA